MSITSYNLYFLGTYRHPHSRRIEVTGQWMATLCHVHVACIHILCAYFVICISHEIFLVINVAYKMTCFCYLTIRLLILTWYIHCLCKQKLMVKLQKAQMDMILYVCVSETLLIWSGEVTNGYVIKSSSITAADGNTWHSWLLYLCHRRTRERLLHPLEAKRINGR